MKSAVLIVAFGCVFLSTVSVYAVEIIMRDHVKVEGDSVYVHDIANIIGDDEVLTRLINDVYICKAPNPGYEREVDKAYLIMKLKHNNCDVGAIRFSGSLYTKVSVQEYIVSIDQQKSALTAWISRTLNIETDGFKVSYRKEPRDIVVTSEDIDIVFKGDVKTFMGRSVGVYMELYAYDKLLKRSAFNFSLEFLKDIVVPTRIIQRDELVTAEDVKLEKRYVPGYKNNYFTDLERVVGSVAQRNLSTAEYVTDKDIRARKIVERGDIVDGILRDKNMRLRLTMQAREDGVKGEIIRLFNPTTEKTVRGIVTGEAQVELIL